MDANTLAHTQGRLELRTHSDCDYTTLLVGEGEIVADTLRLVMTSGPARKIHAARAQKNLANARRLAACWNAFDGIDTDKFDGKSISEYVCEEAYLAGMQPAPDGGGLNMGLSGLACQMFASSFAGQFKGSGAVNFLEVGMTHDELGPFIVTIQRVEGETPAQQKAAALAEVSHLTERLIERGDELAAARALLNEVVSNSDSVPFLPVAVGVDLTERIRAFLKGGTQ